jgi:DNA (cytosine-5)-methyltransferase 1
MKDPRSILEEIYQSAYVSRDTLSVFSSTEQEWVKVVVEQAESQKAVLAVLITSLVKKIETPSQDIRYHKAELSNGYSGRSFDTKYVTPFIREKFLKLAMTSGSGWLTRSLEQAHPYTLDYPGRIQNVAVRHAFLQILHDVEENQASPQEYLLTIFMRLIDYIENSRAIFDSISGEGGDSISIENITEILKAHFFRSYGVWGASRLPVLAIYSAYQLLMGYNRYIDKKLCPLKSHTTSDIKSSGIGDIEVLDEQGNFFEGVEIKHNISITPMLIQDAFGKFVNTAVCRYYLLTTAEPEVEDADIDAVRKLTYEFRSHHGCEVIVNGIIPSLKYYLRLLNDPVMFLDCYRDNLQADFNVSTDIKSAHLQYWDELLASVS